MPFFKTLKGVNGVENIINRILEIDKQACERIESAEKQKKQIFSDAKVEEAQIRDEHLKKANIKIDEYDQQQKLIADEKIAKIEEEKLKKISDLQSIYDNNHSSWEQDIFQRIVGE